MTYQEALDYIAGLAPRGWRLGLDRMREFAHRAGLDDALGGTSTAQPPSSVSGRALATPSGTNRETEEWGSPQFIHIAGTNGKGSTTAYVQSILHESGYRTGAFFSPYVYDPRERIQLGRELIPEGIFAGLTAMLKPLAEEFTDTEYGGISEFEFKTAMAFLFYKRLKCEWVALEVGLGGRLDATSIVTPRCGVIVSIGLDHTNILGETIDQIAFEKAGIIKPGIPVVVGQLPEPARLVVERQAAEMGSEIWRYGQEITVGQDVKDRSIVVTTPRGQHAGLTLGIRGAMQGHNMALAVAACDASGATRTLRGLQRGVAKASIPGRFEVKKIDGQTIVLDGAHNADAAQVLVESLRTYLQYGELPGSRVAAHPRERLGKILMVTGMVAGHEPEAFYRWFEDIVDEAFAVPIDFHRSLSPSEIEHALRNYVATVHSYDSATEGIEAVMEAAGPDDLILITGSFYLVGEIGRYLVRQQRKD
ncbi:MAG TPA: folylpolyglutamate synthase/dihydrofolate synthase family protein [Fimbriimonadaceae bacterium]|nr:folylpolyglutamate synthase/dihydrofolate synthase family protein [Fimbriimonadaceae bacterium]